MSFANKYRNIKTVIDNITFDSKAEAMRYMELKLLEKARKIHDLKLQPEYELVGGFTDFQGKKWRPIVYRGDFQYIEDDCLVVEDCKGIRTQVYNVKKKMFLKKYPSIIFREVE